MFTQVRKESGWKFVTSAGVSRSYAFLAKSNGTIDLRSPAGFKWSFNYASYGAGVSVGPKIQVTFSTKSMPNVGKVYLMNGFTGDDLTFDDITGFCTIQDVTMAAGDGISATAMFLGIPAYALPAELSVGNGGEFGLLGPLIDLVLDKLDVNFSTVLSSAKAMLVIAGEAVGGAGAGITASVGYLDPSYSNMIALLKQAEEQRMRH